MTLLDEAQWSGKIFVGGRWTETSGGQHDVVEPATGATLGVLGTPTAEDVATAAESAAAAQQSWAATPYPERAAVLRRAGALWSQYADEISWWNVREVGAIPPMAGFALHVAEQECFEASALPSRAYGELIPSEEPRLSMARRMPAGVVGVISPFNVPIILGIRSVAPALALGNAVDPQARPAHRRHRRRRPRADLRGGGLPAGRVADAAGRHRGRRGDGDAPAHPGHLVHRLVRGRAPGRRAGRAPPQARASRTRRQLRAGRARRRRRRPGGDARGVRLVLPPGRDLHDGRAAHRARDASTTTSSSDWRARRRTFRSAIRQPTRSRSGR